MGLSRSVLSPRCTTDHLLAALCHLLADPAWDVAHFNQLRPDSPLLLVLQQLESATVSPYPGDLCSRCPAVIIADLPRKVRADVLYHRNFATSRGSLELCLANEHDWRPAFDLLVRFHSRRWEQAGESGVLADPAVLAWHREALPLLQAHGLLRLSTLRLADESIAALYSLIDPPSRPSRTQYFYLMGFSTDLAEFRPGTLLTALAIERAAAEGVQTIDMLRGEETYKQFWHVKDVPTFGFAVRRA
jgi:CelD/BcsL family acetyltransferase involved in cellulose biosynthesis